jgi:methyl-accepting chemotaxis protein
MGWKTKPDARSCCGCNDFKFETNYADASRDESGKPIAVIFGYEGFAVKREHGLKAHDRASSRMPRISIGIGGSLTWRRAYNRLRDMPLAGKSILSFALILAILLISSMVILTQAAHLSSVRHQETQANRASRLAASLSDDVEVARGAVREYLLIGDFDSRNRAREALDHYNLDARSLDEILAKTNPPLQIRAAQRLRSVSAALHEGLYAELTLGANKATHAQAILLIISHADRHRRDMDASLQLLERDISDWDQDLSARAAVSVERTVRTIASGGVLAAITILIIGFYVYLNVGKPLQAVVASLRALAQGDLSVAPPDIERRDEIGCLALVVAAFKSTAERNREMEASARAATVQEAEVQRIREEKRVRRAQNQGEIVASLGNGLSMLASGNLVCEIAAHFPDGYDALRVDFNATVRRLRDAMIKVTDLTLLIEAGCGEIKDLSDALAERTEQQAVQLEQSSNALSAITQAVRQSALAAQQARVIAQGANAHAEQSVGAVQRADKAIHEIEAVLSRIAEISRAIDRIATQTHLLALNTSVEAARANCDGRGFSVLAVEIRELARHARERAGEIGELVSQSDRVVSQGLCEIANMSQSLTIFSEHVETLSMHTVSISQATQDQAAGLTQINEAVRELDEITASNSVMAIGTHAAVSDLSLRSSDLSKAVVHFKIGGD